MLQATQYVNVPRIRVLHCGDTCHQSSPKTLYYSYALAEQIIVGNSLKLLVTNLLKESCV